MESSRAKVTQSSMSSANVKSGGAATVYIPSPSLLLQRTQRVYSSALTASTAATSLPGEHHQSPKTSHVVKIQIPRIEHQSAPRVDGVQTSSHTKSSTRVSIVPIVVDRVPNKLSKDSQAPFQHTDQPKVTEMVQKHETPGSDLDVVSNSSYLYYIPNSTRSSGQCSPDTLDSGTCSDMEATPPPLPKKMSKTPMPCGSGSASPVQQQASSTPSGSPQPPVNGAPRHVRNGSVTDSEESESSLSCDSLNCAEVIVDKSDAGKIHLPDSLLKDIRKRSAEQESDKNVDFTIASMQRDDLEDEKDLDPIYDTDRFYKFYINEWVQDPVTQGEPKIVDTDESFAGYRDIQSGTSTIRSSKGTIRGVKNRVRNGIVTFQQMQSNLKNFKEKDSGKVVLYTTSMGIVRGTYAKCFCLKQILRTLLIKFEERDVFMSTEYQQEIKDRMQCDSIDVPQLFVDGQHIGNAETVERLNEEGELRKMLKAYKCLDPCYTCKMCGGYRLLPCPSCNGSKKSVHRNHFTAEFVSLKCMNCDSSGLIFCNFCKST